MTVIPGSITPAQIDVLTIRHFKAFNGTLEFKLNRKNMVILGENGSGKTSLTRALSAVLDATRVTTQQGRADLFQRCLYADQATGQGFIELSVLEGKLDAPREQLKRRSFRLNQDGSWRQNLGEPPTGPGPAPISTTFLEAAKTKRVLDYKGLLRTYFLTGERVDLWDLLLEDVLTHEENLISRRTFGEDWAEFKQLHDMDRRKGSTKRDLEKVVANLNAGLAGKLTTVVARANHLLKEFDPYLSFTIEPGVIVPAYKGQQLPKGRAILAVQKGNNQVPGHTEVLNEARLSAIALCLHFAVLLDVPRTHLSVLILDDVLIGLDMDNRLPVLRLLENHFDAWQVVMLTYDSVWYESVREWSEKKDRWGWATLQRDEELEGTTTLLERDKGMLAVAKSHLKRGDLVPAAVSARSAMESVLKRYFDAATIAMPYKRNPKDLKLDAFWQQACTLRDSSGALLIPASVQRQVSGARSIVLNPLAHDPSKPLTKREVDEALAAVEALAVTLNIGQP